MADIVYQIEYDDDKEFQFPKPVDVRTIGTEPDRIGIVTTTQTAEYLKKKGQRVALQREKGRDPFGDKMDQIYVVPVGIENAEFFDVKEPGRRKGAFHLTCGQVGLHDKKEFEPWGKETRVVGGPGKKPSFPLP